MRHLAGTSTLVRLVLRRDRLRLPVWILAILALVYLSAAAVADAYATAAQREAYAATVGASPTAQAMGGPPFGLSTIGGILVYETSMSALIGVALMAIFLTVRHTRADEDEGRTEMLRSTVVGRYAPNAATFVVLAGASLVIGAGVGFSVLSVEGIAVGGALVFGASIAAFGIVFASIASVAAQLMSHGRSATGLSVSLLGLAFVLRAIGDVGNSAWSWLSPMGWSQQVAAFDKNRWWPLLISVALSVVLLTVAAVLVARRDLGAGVVPPRPGPPVASRLLGGPTGLALRLQRGSIIGWGIGVFVFGLIFGSFSQDLLKLVEDNPTLAQYFAAAGSASLVDSYFAVALLITSLLAAAFAVASVLRIRGEESSGRAEQMLATRMSRAWWLFGSLAVSLFGTVVVLLAGGLGIGLAHAWVSDDMGVVLPLVGQTLVYLPAVLLLGALAVLLIGVLPRWAALAWVALAFSFVIGYLGGLLDPPRWLADLSPFSHTPQAPAEVVTATPLLVLSLLVVLAVAAGAVGLRQRDMG